MQYDDQVYNWTPVSPLPAADECALICKGRDQNVTRRLSPTVLDGTPCRSGSRDMCLNGKCIVSNPASLFLSILKSVENLLKQSSLILSILKSVEIY